MMYSKGFAPVLSSANRSSGTDTDFQINCKIPQPSAGYDFNVVALVKAVVPRSFWCITAPFNTFTVRENDLTYTVTVPEGNYSTPAWCSQIGTTLTAASLASGHHYTYTCVKAANDTGLLVYTVTNNGGVQPSIIINANGDLAHQLGLPADPLGNTKAYAFSGNQLTSTGVYSYLGDYAVNIYSDICEADGDQGLLGTIFGASTTNTQSVIIHEAQDHILSWKRFQRSGRENFRFQIKSSSTGQTLDTHDNPVSFQLKFMYDPADQTNDLLKLLIAEFRLLREALATQGPANASESKGVVISGGIQIGTPNDFTGLIRSSVPQDFANPSAIDSGPLVPTAVPAAVEVAPKAIPASAPPEPTFEPAPVMGGGESSEDDWESSGVPYVAVGWEST